MKTRIIACTAALIAVSFAYAAEPVMSAGSPGSGTPTKSTGAGGAMVGATAQDKASQATPIRSIGTGGRGQGAGTSATPIEVISSVTSAAATEPSIKMASSSSSVTVGDPIKVTNAVPQGAAAPTVKEGTTPSSKGPAPKS